MKLINISTIILLIALLGCEDNTFNTLSGPSVSELEAQVIANCIILVAALDSFAAENDGSCSNLPEGYPADVLYDTTCANNCLIDLLPDRKHLINPFTGASTEPVNRFPQNPGEIGYEPLSRFRFYDFESQRFYSLNPGYTIIGFGKDSVVAVFSNLDELEDMVRSDCYLVQQAVEQWAIFNDGVYPLSVYGDTNDRGEYVVDLLPGGSLLQNHFTKVSTNPVDREAVLRGEIGYEPIAILHDIVGYRITGVGRENNVLVCELIVE